MSRHDIGTIEEATPWCDWTPADEFDYQQRLTAIEKRLAALESLVGHVSPGEVALASKHLPFSQAIVLPNNSDAPISIRGAR